MDKLVQLPPLNAWHFRMLYLAWSAVMEMVNGRQSKAQEAMDLFIEATEADSGQELAGIQLTDWLTMFASRDPWLRKKLGWVDDQVWPPESGGR